MRETQQSLWRYAAFAFACGAVGGSGLDAFHTHSGTTMYAREWFAKMAWWTPLLFGATGVIALGAYPLIERRLGRALAPAAKRSHLAAGVLVFALLYAASGFLAVSNAAKLFVMLGGALALFALLGRSLGSIGIALIAASMGSLVEASLVHAGAFWYVTPDRFGIPMWLPGLYAVGAFALGPLGARLWQRQPMT